MTVQPAPDQLDSARLTAGRPTSRWGSRLATVVTAYHLGRQVWETYQRYARERTYTVTVEERDELFAPVQAWVLDRMPAGAQRSLSAHCLRDGQRVVSDDFAVPNGSEPPQRRVALYYDGSRRQTVHLEGHAVSVHVEHVDSVKLEGQYSRGDKVIFTAPDLDARAAVVRFLEGVAASLSDGRRPPRLYCGRQWGDWQLTRDVLPRPLDSVVLPAGQAEDLLADVHQFLASEARYTDLGVPWHRGYLFHGPPGTGKSSTARALATALSMDVYYLPLSDLTQDTNLNTMLAQLPPRVVLLLEDVDVAHAARARDDDRKGVTMAGLLNALDGMVTPHGLVSVLTTNDRSALDPALLRRGRVDREVEMTYLVPEQFVRLCLHLVPDMEASLSRVEWDGYELPRLTAADVVGAVTRHLHDPVDAAEEIAHLVFSASVRARP